MERRDVLTGGAALGRCWARWPGRIRPGPNPKQGPDDLANAKGVWGLKVSTDDYVEIQQLYHRYCHALDMGAGEAFAACFTPDGEFTGGRGPGKANDDRTPRKGTAALVQMGNTSGTRHFTANLVVTRTPEGAKGSCYLLLYSARATPDAWVEIAIYNDWLVKTAEGWKFKKRVVWRDDDDITPFKPKPPRGAMPVKKEKWMRIANFILCAGLAFATAPAAMAQGFKGPKVADAKPGDIRVIVTAAIREPLDAVMDKAQAVAGNRWWPNMVRARQLEG